MEEQDIKGAYKVTCTYPDGQIESVEFYHPRTIKEIKSWSPHPTLDERRLGLKISISPVDDAVLSALLDLSGMRSCKLSDAHVYIRVIDEVVREKKHEKVIDLTKPRPKVKSKLAGFKSRTLSEKKPEKALDLKPRRRGQPTSGVAPTSNERQNPEVHDSGPA